MATDFAGGEGALTCRCGVELPPQRGPGRRREWCSERCRKRTLYASRCVDCGAMCNIAGEVTNPHTRCRGCAKRRQEEAQIAAAERRMREAVGLRASGLRNAEIAERMGVTVMAVANLISRAKKRGWDVPRDPYNVDRRAYLASTSGRAKARELRAEGDG